MLPLDDNGLQPQLRRADGRDIPAGAATDDRDIECFRHLSPNLTLGALFNFSNVSNFIKAGRSQRVPGKSFYYNRVARESYELDLIGLRPGIAGLQGPIRQILP
jgi:hypothetical protein